MKHRTTKLGLALAAAVACLLMATPASAVVYNYNVEMVSGRISVGSMNFDTPGVGVPGCDGATVISGTIDDALATDNITGNLSINSPFVLPLFGGNYALVASGTATGTNAGNYNAGTRTFTGMVFPTVTFSVRTYNATTCTVNATTVCSGTATLTGSGGLMTGVALPLTIGEDIYVNATGSITARNSCSFPFSSFISVGTSLNIGDNPGDDFDGNGVADPGAIFEQL